MNPHPDNEGGAAVSAPSEIEETLGAGAELDAPDDGIEPVRDVLPPSAWGIWWSRSTFFVVFAANGKMSPGWMRCTASRSLCGIS